MLKNDPPLNRLSDGELQERIERFGRLMLEAHARYLRRPYAVADRAECYRWWLEQKAVLHERARRRRIVARMEQEMGLA